MSAVPPDDDRRPERQRLELPGPEDPDGLGLPRPNRKLVLGLLALIVAFVAFKLIAGAGSGGHLVATSCTTPALGIGATTVPHGATLPFEVTGPQDDAYVVWVDAAASTTGSDGQPEATPLVEGEPTQLLLPPTRLTACNLTTTHALEPQIATGHHVVVLFQVRADGTQKQVATTSITVTSH